MRPADQIDPLIQSCSCFFCVRAPTRSATFLPSLKIIIVGIAWIAYFCVTAGFWSTSSLAILTLPFSSVATASSAGAMALHGPHHSAKKSTTTGSADFSTSWSKFASDTESVAPPLGIGPVSFGLPHEGIFLEAHGEW